MKNKTENEQAFPYQKEKYKEEIGMETLAKKALEEALRDGGAFAQENPDQFKQ